MTYQVLLVDDEQIYLQYLQQMIDWESLHCQICGCAQNGEDAISMAEELKPDIIFMDINMSKMDGLEVCETLRQNGSGVKIIIMTAFNEFSFAHRAIKLNVVDYLLKPFGEEELKKTLMKCIEEIQKDQENFLKELLDSEMSGEEWEQLESVISSQRYLAVLFRREGGGSFGGRAHLRNLLSSYFVPFAMDSYLLGYQKGCEIVILTMSKEQIPLSTVKRQFQKLLREHPEEKFAWVSIGDVVEGIENLQKTYQNAQLVRENRAKMQGSVNTFEEVRQLDSDIALTSSSDVNALIKAFEMKEYDKVDQMIEKMFGLSQNQRFSFQYVIATYYSLVSGIYGYYHYNAENSLEELEGTQSNLLSEMAMCSTAQQMLEIIRNYVYEVFSDCIYERVGSKKVVLAAKVEKYLQQHYEEKSLSVNQIAESLYFENSYIRRVFKLQTGKTIIQRLEEIRLEKARELLREGKYKNSEVAEMTGYCDQYYFSKRFKMICGCSPTEYQRTIHK